MKQKQRRQKHNERDKNKKPEETKNKDKTEERKEQERDRERESEEGGRQKKAKGEQRETLKFKQKMPFLAGKIVFLWKQTKERNKKKGERTKKTNKEGLGPSEVSLWATSPDP